MIRFPSHVVLPDEVWIEEVLGFLQPHDRLRFLAALEVFTDLRCRRLKLSSSRVSRRQILLLYGQGVIPPHEPVDTFLWTWCLRSASRRDPSLTIDHHAHTTMQNMERHFTEEWEVYGGRLLSSSPSETLLVPCPERPYDSHFVDHVLGLSLGRAERYIDLGYADF